MIFVLLSHFIENRLNFLIFSTPALGAGFLFRTHGRNKPEIGKTKRPDISCKVDI
jgi:hypothetical protein